MGVCNPAVLQQDCTLETCCISEQGWLDYLPNIPGNAFFLAVFGLSAIAQLGLGIRYRTWGFAIGMTCGALLEVIGYGGRIALSSSTGIFDKNYFVIYLVCLTIAPAFLTAAIYLCLARLVKVWGLHFSRVRPATYTIVFVTCDVVSLVLQALGGAIASAGSTQSTVNTGTHIMIAGLAFQVFSLLLFMVACGDFMLRIRRSKQSSNLDFDGLRRTFKFKAFQIALAIATLTIFVRCVFRVAELQGGFDSKLANDEVAFMILEGPMIIIAVGALTIFHPGLCFGGRWADANFTFRKKNEEQIRLESTKGEEA